MSDAPPPTTALAPIPAAREDFMETAIDVAREAGKLALSELPLGRFPAGEIEEKGPRNLVSRVDRASEALIVRRLAEAYPDHAIVAEEGGGRAGAGGPYRWYVDPIDGTTNFLHGHPFFAVSVALYRGDVPEAGAVYLPYFDEMFFAARGRGAFLNATTLKLLASPVAGLERAMVATGFAPSVGVDVNHHAFLRVARKAQAVRRCGAAAIDLCFVAAGRYDAFWERGLAPWDVAAGALMVREAGGIVTDLEGGEDWLHGGHLVSAGTPALATTLRKLVGDAAPPEGTVRVT
ncbi:MAG: inositol monophosphatase family protein [Myxococcota bacterium]